LSIEGFITKGGKRGRRKFTGGEGEFPSARKEKGFECGINKLFDGKKGREKRHYRWKKKKGVSLAIRLGKGKKSDTGNQNPKTVGSGRGRKGEEEKTGASGKSFGFKLGGGEKRTLEC